MKKLFVFFLTCITELSHVSLWCALFSLAVGWPSLWRMIVLKGPASFWVLFACIASLTVPLLTATVFGIVLAVLERKNNAS